MQAEDLTKKKIRVGESNNVKGVCPHCNIKYSTSKFKDGKPENGIKICCCCGNEIVWENSEFDRKLQAEPEDEMVSIHFSGSHRQKTLTGSYLDGY